jgi:tRNA dimethylallyltransferase
MGEPFFVKKPRLVAVVGPTASGKSSLALNLALKFGGEIISADSVQVYRGLDIGTAKPSAEERRLVPHHLIDILDPDQEHSAALFRKQADEVIHRLHLHDTPIFVAGGTGLYLKVLSRGIFRGPGGDSQVRDALHRRAETEGKGVLHRELQLLDPESASRIHPHDILRIIRALEVCSLAKKPISHFQREHGFRESPYEILKIGLQCDREALFRRIECRVEEMLKMGWVEEVKSLLMKGYSPTLKSMQTVGYKHFVSHLTGEIDLARAVELTKRDTRRYAKRQITWFKADKEIHWLAAGQRNEPGIEARILEFFGQC